MNRPHCAVVCARSWLAGHPEAWIIGLAAVWMASAPSPAWGQWTGGPTGPIYYNGGSVGIGTATPGARLNVYSPGAGTGVVIGNPSTGSGGYTSLLLYTTADTNGRSSLQSIQASGAAWGMLSINPNGGNVGIGTANPQYLLSVKGVIGAQEVVVTNTGWSDYVFRPGYRLRPLSEIDAFIQAHHHLPDIPSEREVQEKGASVGEMQAKLLGL